MSGLYGIKPAFVRSLRGIEDALVARRVSPDALTYAALAVSAAAGAAVVAGISIPGLWVLVAPLVLIRLALNALDGSIARRTRVARRFGQALNEMCDRMSDACVIAPFAFVAPPAVAFGALACAFLASFAGVLALGVAGARDYAGPMGKADRMAVAGGAALAGIWWHPAFTAGVAVIGAGALATAAGRIGRIHKACERTVKNAEAA